MTEIILTILAIIGVIIFILEFANIMAYGWLTKKTVPLDRANLNSYNISILNLPVSFISTNISLFSKYYICGIGTVPRWSKFHRQIEAKYQELLNQI